MFMGEYHHSIDAKGRIIVPSKVRDDLGENFIVTRGLDGCLFLYPKVEWDKIINILNEAPSFSECTNMLFEIGLSYSDFIEFYGIEKIKNAVLYAKDLKDRYTVLWLNYKYFERTAID